MARKQFSTHKGFYWTGDLNALEIASFDKIATMKRVTNFEGILKDIKLHDFQTKSAAYGAINNRFFFGHQPGLGKTIIIETVLRHKRNKQLLDLVQKFGITVDESNKQSMELFIREMRRLTNSLNMTEQEIIDAMRYNPYYEGKEFKLDKIQIDNLRQFLNDNENVPFIREQVARTLPKILIATTQNAVYQMKNSFEVHAELSLLPLTGDAAAIKRILKKNNVLDYDGIITSHAGLRSNAMLLELGTVVDRFDTFVLDESWVVQEKHSPQSKKKNTQVVTTAITLSDMMKNVYFMNGTAISKSLNDYYNQLDIMNPRLMPTKTWFKDRYYIFDENAGYFSSEVIEQDGYHTMGSKFNKISNKIAGYKNTSEIRDRLQYVYHGLEKREIVKELPPMRAVLVPVLYNGPTAGDTEASYNNLNLSLDAFSKITKMEVMIDDIFRIVNREQREQVFVYCWYKAPQPIIKDLLAKKGISAVIINGEDTDAESKWKKQQLVNERKVDVVISNIQTAVDFTTINEMCLFTSPITAKDLHQIAGRIDRDNYDTAKTYRFYVYTNSPEVLRIARLAEREAISNEALGKSSTMAQELISSLVEVMSIPREEIVQLYAGSQENKLIDKYSGEMML